ncbi:MAG: AAA family ATPase [Kiritimatiellae bacterium]|nr:AAA family ATPase [Kiritimatiellia bacterium]
MKRKIYSRLLEWKRNEAGECALLIDGARRVGKSYIAEEFAKNEYRSYLLVNFAKASGAVKNLFSEYQEQLDLLFLKLCEVYGVRLYPGESLVIFDEVQDCPKARESIKHLVADGRYHYLETGSLVSINENVEKIVIPSEEERVKMYPMDFEEFLWALGDEMTMEFIRDHFISRDAMGPALHRKCMDYFRQYLVVGGMPQAVEAFAEKRDLGRVDRIKRRILQLYREDVQKHAGRYALKTLLVFDGIPSQLSRHEKKFRLSTLAAGARVREYEDAFIWLREAMVVNVCFRSTEPSLGLALNTDSSTLKCYLGDTGLLVSLAFTESQIASEQIHARLLMDALEINKGMLVENIVAQMLKANGYELFFFSSSNQAEKSDRMEIDFLIPRGAIGRRHNILPIEVKSSKRYDHTSLNKFRTKYGTHLSEPLVLHTKDVCHDDGVTYLPLYMASCLSPSLIR